MTTQTQDNQVQQSSVPQQQQPQAQEPRPGTPESSTPRSGYFSANGQVVPAGGTPPEVQQQGFEQQQKIDALGQKLGINPQEIGMPAPPQQQPPVPQVNAEDWYAKQFDSAEAKQFAENFKKYVGIDIKEVYQTVQNTAQVTQGVENWRREVHAQQQLDNLKREFGDDYDNIMPQVIERFGAIRQSNPQQAAALDNVDGAKMLAALIRQEQSQGRYNVQAPTNVPNYLPNRRQVSHGQGNQPPVIKMSEFVNWSDAEVQSRYNEILQAKQAGTFIYDY